MPNYSTNLKTWGSTGSEYPDSYSYVEGEQPVDEWDNFLTSNLIDDVQHLVGVTNDDLIAKDGSVAMEAPLGFTNSSFPGGDEFRASPDEGSASDGDESLDIQHYDSSAGTTNTILEVWASGRVNIPDGDLDVGGTTVFDYSNNYIPLSSLEQDSYSVSAGDGLDGGGTVNLGGSLSLSVDVSDFAGAGLQDDGSENLELVNDSITINGDTVALGGSTTVPTYSDSDAISAINNDGDHGSTASHNYFSGDHADRSNIGANDHHAQNHDNSDHTTNYLPSSDYTPEADTHSPPTETQTPTFDTVTQSIQKSGNQDDGAKVEEWVGLQMALISSVEYELTNTSVYTSDYVIDMGNGTLDGSPFDSVSGTVSPNSTVTGTLSAPSPVPVSAIHFVVEDPDDYSLGFEVDFTIKYAQVGTHSHSI